MFVPGQRLPRFCFPGLSGCHVDVEMPPVDYRRLGMIVLMYEHTVKCTVRSTDTPAFPPGSVPRFARCQTGSRVSRDIPAGSPVITRMTTNQEF